MASAHLQTGLDLECLDIGSDVTSQNECRKRLAKINFESLGFLKEFKILLALSLYIWTKAMSRDSPALSLQRGRTFLTGSSLYLLYRVAKPRTMSCVSCHVPATRELLPPLSPVMLNRDPDARCCNPILGLCVCESSLPFLILRKIWTQSLWYSKNNKISTDGAVRHLHGGLFGGWRSCLRFSLPPSFSPSNILFCF